MKPHGGINADVMGIGKTLQILSVLSICLHIISSSS